MDNCIFISALSGKSRDDPPTRISNLPFSTRAACKRLGRWNLSDCDLYVTLEPCAMCAGAVVYSRLKNVYFGAYDLRFGCAGTVRNIACDPALNHRACVTGGILKEECKALLTAFFADKRKKK